MRSVEVSDAEIRFIGIVILIQMYRRNTILSASNTFALHEIVRTFSTKNFSNTILEASFNDKLFIEKISNLQIFIQSIDLFLVCRSVEVFDSNINKLDMSCKHYCFVKTHWCVHQIL